jgi:hypothetical protein
MIVNLDNKSKLLFNNKSAFMPQNYHIRANKDYAISLLELLKKDNAIEDLQQQDWELSDWHKKAVDKELDLIANNPDYLQKWSSVNSQFK